MNKLIRYGLAAALLVAALPLHAQSVFDNGAFSRLLAGDPVSGAIGLDGDIALVIKYVGANHGGGASGSVASTQGTSLVFTSGAAGSETADAVVCPVGGTAGTIDVTNAACDTIGEVVDVLNASANWRAVALDSIRSDASTKIKTLSATVATKPAGLNLPWLTSSGTFKSTIALTPYRDMTAYIDNRNDQLLPNPYTGQRAVFLIGNATSTYGSGTSTYSILSCAENYNTTLGTETCTTLYSVAAGGSTTAATFNYLPYGIIGGKNQKLVARLTNSAAMTAVAHYATGMSWFFR